MNIFVLCGCGIIVCILILTIKQHRPDIAIVLSAAAGVVLFAYMAADLHNLVYEINNLIENISGFKDEAIVVVRVLGICVVSQLTSDVCRDAGQITVASRIETGGKVVAVIMIMPLFARILEISEMIIKG